MLGCGCEHWETMELNPLRLVGALSLPTRLSPSPHAGTRGKENRPGAAGDRAGVRQPPPPSRPGEQGSRGARMALGGDSPAALCPLQHSSATPR